MPTLISREIRLKSRPLDWPEPENFELAEREVAEPGDGEVRVRNLWMSVDPYMGNRLFDRPNYVTPFVLGEALDGGAVGIVETSRADGYEPGDLVSSHLGWREAFVEPAARLRKLPVADIPVEAHLGLAGITGMTAYVALRRIAKLEAGETLYVSAAAGAVGSAACQMAKIAGATVIGSAGGEDKRRFLAEIGVDHAIDYRAASDLEATLAVAAPHGIDVYLDNVGGDQLQAALANMARFGRIAACGMISNYREALQPGPNNLFEIISRRLKVEGFLLTDHAEAVREEFFAQVTKWIADGRLVNRETVRDGIGAAPAAFIDLFSGRNMGKMLVRL